jgi:hypothetical protein
VDIRHDRNYVIDKGTDYSNRKYQYGLLLHQIPAQYRIQTTSKSLPCALAESGNSQELDREAFHCGEKKLTV